MQVNLFQALNGGTFSSHLKASICHFSCTNYIGLKIVVERSMGFVIRVLALFFPLLEANRNKLKHGCLKVYKVIIHSPYPPHLWFCFPELSEMLKICFPAYIVGLRTCTYVLMAMSLSIPHLPFRG